jgi:hypothetical protein
MMAAIPDSAVIKFTAEVHAYRSTVDQGIFITLGLSEDDIAIMAMLAECKRAGILLQIEARAIKPQTPWQGSRGDVVGQGD